jgi:hypothetical protein
MSSSRPLRAGESVEDFCRQCKTDRLHTIVVVDGQGLPLRVVCGYCRSEHNYRGGPRIVAGAAGTAGTTGTTGTSGTPGTRRDEPSRRTEATVAAPAYRRTEATGAAFDIVGDRERIGAPMTASGSTGDLEMLLRRIIREEAGVTAAVPAEKWRGGSLVLRPSAPALQEKSWPIETFFHKVVMLRNRLRTLEQHLNASDLPDDVKVKLQSYITGCYGSLTSFNVLFAEEEDQFRGSGGD